MRRIFEGKVITYKGTASFLAAAFLSLLFLPVQSGGGPQPQAVSKASEFVLPAGERKVIEIEIAQPGDLKVEAAWQEASSALAIILNGPGRAQYYARKDGPSPLALSFKISSTLVELGKSWKISVVNFNRSGQVQGSVRYTFSPETSIAAPVAETPQVQAKKTVPTAKVGTKEKKVSGVSEAKSLTVKYFEVQESKGYSREELAQIQAGLQAQKREALRTRLKNRIEKLSAENKLAPILIPLFFQRLEELAANPKSLRSRQVSSSLQEVSEAYRSLAAERKVPFLSQNIGRFNINNKAERIQLGKLIVNAIDPGFEQNIREAVRVSSSPQNPDFAWKASGVSRPAVTRALTSGRTAALTPQSQISKENKLKINNIVSQLAQKPGYRTIQAEVLNQLQELIQPANFTSNLQVNLNEKFDPGQLKPYIPDLNSQHQVYEYDEYKVELDRLECVGKNERSPDEAYLVIQTILPRFDAKDSVYSADLAAGKLYNVSTKATSTYGGIDAGDLVGFRSYDKFVFQQLLYNTQATLLLDLYEEDYSKGQVVSGYQDAVSQLRQTLTNEIKAAVKDYVRDAIEVALGQVIPPQAVVILDMIFSGQFDESMLSQLNDSLGKIKTDLIILGMIFSGKSFADVINYLSAGNPEIFLVVMAIEVAGPILMDFLQGNWKEGFKAILFLPLTVLQSFISVFTDLEAFFSKLMACIDPDDHIQTRQVIIRQGGDADWDQRDIPGAGSGAGTEAPPTMLKSMPIRIQPQLWFASGMTFYKLYYNVERVLCGGKEIFGFTLDPDKGIYSVTKIYRVKSPFVGDPIVVKISTLNTLDVPFVWMSGTGGSNGNPSGERVFEVPGFHDRDYTLTIANLAGRSLYGYISVEENNEAVPWRGGSPGGSSGGSNQDKGRLK